MVVNDVYKVVQFTTTNDLFDKWFTKKYKGVFHSYRGVADGINLPYTALPQEFLSGVYDIFYKEMGVISYKVNHPENNGYVQPVTYTIEMYVGKGDDSWRKL